MAVQYTGHVIQMETCDNNTALPLVGVLVTCSLRTNRLSSTIDGNTECSHFQYSCLNIISVNSNFLSDETINKNDIFRLKGLSFSEISAILYVLYFCFYTFSFNVL